VAYGHGHLLVGDQVFKLQLALSSRICVRRASPYLSAHLFEFLHDDRAQLGFAGQDRFVLGNALAHLLEFDEQARRSESCVNR